MLRTYINGKIFTSNPDQPYADTIVIEDGMIRWIGEQTDLPVIVGECIDLMGRRVLPGLIDSHMHPLILADTATQISCTLPTVGSIADLLLQIRSKRTAQEGTEGILCWGFDEGKLSEGRSPDRWDLDKACNDVPVLARRICGHISVVNSRALEIAGIDKDTPNPPGGEIDRRSDGTPTGILKETAQYLVRPYFPKRTKGEKVQLLCEISHTLSSYGITSVTDMDALEGFYELYVDARAAGYQQRTALYYAWVDNKKHNMRIEGKMNRAEPIHIAGVKLFADGSISGKTAWVSPGYLNDERNRGISVTSVAEILEAADYAKAHQLQVSVHAMGEQACDQVMNSFESKGNWLEGIPSVRLEHGALFSDGALERAREARVAFSVQPVFAFAEIESYVKGLGLERTQRTYPVRTMLQLGLDVAISTDAPATAWAEPAHPFVNMKAAVTRMAYDGTDLGQDERINVAEAIIAYTRTAQHITGIPQIGQLKPGFHADFIVLDRDILSSDPMELDQIQVIETYIGGEQVFKR